MSGEAIKCGVRSLKQKGSTSGNGYGIILPITGGNGAGIVSRAASITKSPRTVTMHSGTGNNIRRLRASHITSCPERSCI